MVSVQPAVKKETRNVAIITATGVILMLLVFFILHIFFPDSVPFNYTVVLAGICAGIVAVLNFFLMGLAVQKIAATADQDEAKKMLQKSYYRRFGLQVLWIIAAIAAPCFNIVAGLIPLLFPGFGIRMRGVLAHLFPKLGPKIGIGDDPAPEPDESSDKN
ncbi:MAG: hypothetical protein J5824_05150 [Lachnospiraceae bacterium]|nr:hypothetical protein [Lachnospiraceae bacterium]